MRFALLKRCCSLLVDRRILPRLLCLWVLGGLSGCGSNVAVTNLQLTLTPATLGFGIVGLNMASAAQSLTLTNTGMAAAAITGTTVSGDFSLAANSCGSTLAIGSTCQIRIVFTPTALGTRAGTVTVMSNAGAQTVALTGTGGTSLATLSPGALNFGSVAVGSSSAAQTVTITSSGTAALALSSILVAGDFAETANSCTAVLAAGTSCQVTLVFTPGAFGVRSGTLTGGEQLCFQSADGFAERDGHDPGVVRGGQLFCRGQGWSPAGGRGCGATVCSGYERQWIGGEGAAGDSGRDRGWRKRDDSGRVCLSGSGLSAVRGQLRRDSRVKRRGEWKFEVDGHGWGMFGGGGRIDLCRRRGHDGCVRVCVGSVLRKRGTGGSDQQQHTRAGQCIPDGSDPDPIEGRERLRDLRCRHRRPRPLSG